MRIVHVIDCFQPQLGYQETYLAKEQLRAGHEVFVVTSDRYRKVFYEGGGVASTLGTRWREVGLGREAQIPVYRLTSSWEIGRRVWLRGLESQLAELAPDAIHIHGMVTLTTIRVALAHLWNSSLQSAILLVDDHMYAEVSKSKLRVFYPLFRLAVTPLIQRSVDWIVAVSKATRDFMRMHYGLSEQDIKVIRLGVDENLFRPDPLARQAFRQRLGISDSDFLCIYTGKIMPRKQVDILISAVAALASSYPELRLLVLGYASSDYLATLKAQVVKLRITDRVLWHPAVSQEELPRYFSAADAAVWPAEHSISFIEAMSCGLPLIVGDAPKCSEEVAYDNGLIFPVGDQEALAAQLRVLLDSPDLRAEMGAASRKAVERHYTWSAINDQFMHCYTRSKRFGTNRFVG